MKSNMSVALLAIAGVASMTTMSSAAILTFTNQASWEAALSASALEDFEGVAADDDFTGSSTTVGALGLSSVEESTFSNNMLVDVGPLHFNSPESTSPTNFSGDNYVSMRFLSNSTSTSGEIDTVTVSLPAAQSAFSFEYNNYDSFGGDGVELSFAGDNGAVVTTIFSTPDGGGGFDPNIGFFGVVDDTNGEISSFTFAGISGGGTSTFMSFDDVRWGVAIPEPTSVALLSMIGLALGLRRKM